MQGLLLMKHMAISKAVVLGQLEKAQREGADTTEGILGGTPMSLAAAIENLKNDKREVITGCDNFDSKGYCRGCTETAEPIKPPTRRIQ